MNRRPPVNTRDEPHCRLQLNIGVSTRHVSATRNMSEWATALKAGTTALVLDLIERGAAPQLEIAQPIDATSRSAEIRLMTGS